MIAVECLQFAKAMVAYPSIHENFMHAVRSGISIDCILKLTKKMRYVKAISG